MQTKAAKRKELVCFLGCFQSNLGSVRYAQFGQCIEEYHTVTSCKHQVERNHTEVTENHSVDSRETKNQEKNEFTNVDDR
jgi:hypothetical protein